MSAEKIIEQIKKDSEKEINSILNDAKKQAQQIIENSKTNAKNQAETILEKGKKQSLNKEKIMISQANQQQKKQLMDAREKIIEECFVKAHHKLCTLDEKRYKNIVSKLMKDGIAKLGKDCKIFTSRDIDKSIANSLKVKVSGTIEASGGFILKSADDRVILDYTFDGILKREKEKIRIKVGKLLFS